MKEEKENSNKEKEEKLEIKRKEIKNITEINDDINKIMTDINKCMETMLNSVQGKLANDISENILTETKLVNKRNQDGYNEYINYIEKDIEKLKEE